MTHEQGGTTASGPPVVVVIGASAEGVEALQGLVSELPEEATYRGMIDSALQGAPVDAVLGVAELAAEIGRMRSGPP